MSKYLTMMKNNEISRFYVIVIKKVINWIKDETKFPIIVLVLCSRIW